VYKPEMLVEKHVNRKRKGKGQNTMRHRIDLLKLDDVYILVYDLQREEPFGPRQEILSRGCCHKK
jgi:hypothetical protein